MPEIFGAPVGIMSVDADRRDQAVTMMNLANGAQKLEAGQIELQKQRSIMQQLSQRTQGQNGSGAPGRAGLPGATTPDLANDMFDIAGIALNSGDFEYADKLATTGNKLLEGTAKIQKDTFETNTKRLNVMSNLMAGVSDQATWSKANAQYTAMTGEQSPYAKYQYNPDLVEKIKVGVTSARDKAYIANEESQVALRRVTAVRDAHEIGKIDAETRKIKDQDTLILKNGGKPPTNVELEPISDQITQEYGKKLGPAAARTLARPIYSRAKELMSAEGLTFDEARERAYQEAKDSGGLKNLKPEEKADDQATILANRLLQRLNADKGRTNLGLTGLGGKTARAWEDVRNHLPGPLHSDDTSANDFDSDTDALRLLLPKALELKGQTSKATQELVKNLAKSQNIGASNQNSASALNEVVRSLTGKDSPYFQGKRFNGSTAKSAPEDKSGFQVGVTYTNPKGQKGIYRGNGKWEEVQ